MVKMSREEEAALAPLNLQQKEAVRALIRLSPAQIPPKARRAAVTAFPLRLQRKNEEANASLTTGPLDKTMEIET